MSLYAIGFLASGVKLFAGETPVLPALDDFKIPLWYQDYTIRNGWGYKDNVLLSSASTQQGSAFWSAGGDAMFYRLPSSGWQFHLLASFDYVGYFNPTVDVGSEEFGSALAQFTLNLGNNWKLGLGMNYLYQHQVYDTTVTQTNQTIGVILGNNLTERVSLRKDFESGWAEVEAGVGRQWLALPLDGYWQPQTRVSVGKNYGRGSNLSLMYQWQQVAFDHREQATAEGFTEPGTQLRFYPHLVEFGWHHVWDAKGYWQTTAKAGVESSKDNGSGYYDYNRYYLGPRLRYRAKTWEVSTTIRAAYYHFPVQTVSPADSALREKTQIIVGFHLEKTLGKFFKVFGNYNYDASLSNTDYDHYQANTASAGVDFHF